MMDAICSAIAGDLLSVEGVTSSDAVDLPKATQENATNQALGAVSLLVGSGDRTILERGPDLDMVIILSVLIVADETLTETTPNSLIEAITKRLARKPNWAGYRGRVGKTFACTFLEVEGGLSIPVISWAASFRLVGEQNGVGLPDPEEYFDGR